MQLLLLKYREEVIESKVAKEHAEDTKRSEIMFLKDQVTAEQQERNNMEETLTQEITRLQEDLGEWFPDILQNGGVYRRSAWCGSFVRFEFLLHIFAIVTLFFIWNLWWEIEVHCIVLRKDQRRHPFLFPFSFL